MPVKILLADDNMTAQNMGRKILTEAGYEVIAVSNGAAALKKFAEHRPDLLVLDIYMPGYGGLEVCEKIKTKSPRVGVLLTVGKMELYQPEEGKRVRADGLVVKPFEATDLLAAVAKLSEAMQSKTARYLGPNGNGNASSAGASNGTAQEDDTTESHTTEAAVAITARDLIKNNAENQPAEIAVAAAAVASPVAAEPFIPGVPAESTSVDALVAAFSATAIKYVAPRNPEAEERERELPVETEVFHHSPAASGTAAAATPYEIERQNEAADTEAADPDDQESRWVAVRIPVAGFADGNGHYAPGEASAAESNGPLTGRDALGSELEGKGKQSQEMGPVAPLMEQWLQTSSSNSSSTPAAETSGESASQPAAYSLTPVHDVMHAEMTLGPEPAMQMESSSTATIGEQPQEMIPSASDECAVASATATPPESSAIPAAVHESEVDFHAVAVEAARQVTAESAKNGNQSDEIALAVERALERFRETLIEEIARELEKK